MQPSSRRLRWRAPFVVSRHRNLGGPPRGLRLVAVAAGMALTHWPTAHAQQAGTAGSPARVEAPVHLRLPAGPLEAALYALGIQTDATLSFEPALVQGLRTEGLDGSYTVEQGLVMLLRNSGLQAVQGASGAWQLRRQPASSGAVGAVSTTLDAVVVKAVAERSATTEASGSYAPANVTVAGKIPIPWKEVPASVSVITRQRIEDQNLQTVEDALRQVVGVTAVSYGDGTAYFQSRGHPSDVQYDGMPANNGLQYLGQFDLAMYDRVEVLRGPAGVLQGSGGSAGTVNMVRKRPSTEPAVSAAASAGSWGRGRAELDVSRPFNDSGSVRARAVFAGQSNGSFLDEGRNRHLLAYGVVEADLAPTTQLTLSASGQSKRNDGIDYGVGVHADRSFVRLPRSTFYGVDWSRADGSTRELFAELSHGFDRNWIFKLSYLDRRVDGNSRYGYVNPTVTSGYHAKYTLQAQDGDTAWRGLDANISGQFELAGLQHELLLGFNQAWRRQHSLSGNVLVPDVDVRDIRVPEQAIPFKFGSNTRSEQSGVYAQSRTRLAEPLTLSLGGRLSRYESRSQSLLPTIAAWKTDPGVDTQFTPQLGLVYDLKRNVSLYGSYSEIFQPQTQLAAGNAALTPREGKQLEVGAKGVFLGGRLNATIAAFQIKDTNRAVNDPAHPTFYLAGGEVRSRGWEMEVSGRIAPGWNLYAGYTRLLTKYLRDPVNFGAIYSAEEPRNNLKLWTRYELQNAALRGWFVGGGMRAQSTTSRGADPQHGYGVFDAQLGYNVGRHLSVTLSLNNVFDKNYYVRVPSTYYSVYGDPRNAVLTLRAGY